MKVILSFVLFLLFTTEIKAQVASSSLFITLTDIQSVRIVEHPEQSKAVFSEKKSGKADISILNPSASQIRKFESHPGNTEPESQQNKKLSQIEIPAPVFEGSGNMQMANLNHDAKRGVPLVVYQIDPR